MDRLTNLSKVFTSIVITFGVVFCLAGATVAYSQCAPIEEAILLASDGVAGEKFGVSVAIDGDYAVVGSYRAYHDGIQTGAAFIYHFDGSQWVEEAKLIEPSGEALYNYGLAVAIEGETVVVSAPHATVGYTTWAGMVYVYGRVAGVWTLQQSLAMPEPGFDDMFGFALSLSGDGLLIGSTTGSIWERPMDRTAFVYRFNGTSWLEEARLTHPHPDIPAQSYFGESVSLSGNIAVVGARHAYNGVILSGGAFVFHFDGTTWTEQAELFAEDLVNVESVGFSVAVDGDVVVLGAPDMTLPGMSNAGTTFVFRFDGTQWNQEAALISPDVVPGDNFGRQVGVKGDVIVVTAHGTDNACVDYPYCNSGSAFVFRDDGSQWVLDQEFEASDGMDGDSFGGSDLATDGVKVLVPSYWADDQGSKSGKAYIFSLNCSSVVSGVDHAFPDRTATLHPNYPNPFNPATTIRFSLRTSEDVTLAVYDVSGRLIRVVVKENFAAGDHEVMWYGQDELGRSAPSGVYFVRLSVGDVVESQKVVLSK